MVTKKGKYLSVGIGSSKLQNAYEAGKQAAHESVKDFKEIPNFSLVYTHAGHDHDEIAKGINEVLGRHWVGVSADKQFNSELNYDKDTVVSVLSIESQFMHFGIGVAKDYKKNSDRKAKKAIKDAIDHVKLNKRMEAYLQFTAADKKRIDELIKDESYFIMTYIPGAQVIKKEWVPGHEYEFLSSIVKQVGPNIPIFGGSASSPFEDVPKNIATNYLYAKGKKIDNSAVVIFVATDLLFTIDFHHGFDKTDRIGIVNEVADDGYTIKKLNENDDPVGLYAKMIGITKKKFLKDQFSAGVKDPFAIVGDLDKTKIKEVFANPDNKSLHTNFKVTKNCMINVLKYNDKKILNTPIDNIKKAGKKKKGPISVALFCSCSGRRPLLAGRESKVINNIKKKLGKSLFFGFYSFSEIASDDTNPGEVHSLSVASLFVHDKLITD